MLVLSRKAEESLILTVGAERIEVKVTKLTGGHVELGVAASHAVRIHRSEHERPGRKAAKPGPKMPEPQSSS